MTPGAEVRALVAELLDDASPELEPVGGGDLNEAHAVRCRDGRWLFAKTRIDEVPGSFAAEADGLAWLAAVADGPRTPDVVAVHEPDGPGRGMLVLAWVDPGARAGADEDLGRRLAALHAAGAPAHGGVAPPREPRPERAPGSEPGAAQAWRLGPLVLPGAERTSAAELLARDRLEPLARMARDVGALDADSAAAVGRVAERAHELCGAEEPPARLHGDCWAGNVMAGNAGTWLVDPAAHGGHREIDLAMLDLFGGLSARTLAAYEEVHPLAEGHRERRELWNLVPLLVHAVLFGGGWGARAAASARRLAG